MCVVFDNQSLRFVYIRFVFISYLIVLIRAVIMCTKMCTTKKSLCVCLDFTFIFYLERGLKYSKENEDFHLYGNLRNPFLVPR